MSWQNENSKLTKEFSFSNFKEAVDFIGKIQPLADKLNHHPDILLHSYKLVRVMLTTHEKQKVTKLDYQLAEMIDEIL